MIKVGRYGVALGRVFWFQTKVPTKVRHFLCFWFLKEAKPSDDDKRQEFPIGIPMVHEGRKYRYWRADKDVRKGELVKENKECQT